MMHSFWQGCIRLDKKCLFSHNTVTATPQRILTPDQRSANKKWPQSLDALQPEIPMAIVHPPLTPAACGQGREHSCLWVNRLVQQGNPLWERDMIRMGHIPFLCTTGHFRTTQQHYQKVFFNVQKNTSIVLWIYCWEDSFFAISIRYLRINLDKFKGYIFLFI